MEYFVADSYAGWERIGEPFDKNGKLYTEVKERCDRCVNGIYAIGVENGAIKAHPAYNGVCLKCNGAGWLRKEVRLYTEKEKAALDRAKAKKNEKKEAEAQTRAIEKKAEWLEKYGFNADGETYVYKEPNSYDVRAELKSAGFLFNPTLHWHSPIIPADYEDKVFKISVDDVVEFAAWGEGLFKSGAKDYIYGLLEQEKAPSTSEYVGEVGKKIEFTGTLVRKTGFQSQFGYQNVYTFNDENGNVLTWISAVVVGASLGASVKVRATIKEHKEYKGEKQTVITRAKVEEAV
jgi:hypothetical protein